MSTKKTCPLCRYELFPAEDLGDHGYNPWLDEYDPPLQTSGVSQEYDFVFTHPAIPEFSWEEATISELGLSSAHSSTATRRYFEAYSETHVTPRRRVRETNTRRPGLRKVSTPCREDEDIWITLFSDEEQKLDPPACEDIWVTFLDDDDDDDLVLPHFPSEHSLFIFDHRKIVPDTMFDDLLANHMHWMGDMDGEDELQVYDVFDYLV
ncbi:hypothetical protein EJ02DRAFT_419812 [Clathrospora elynae]|uniref:Uncharacterized protein n=1 Tax=Clathrospora elynae TaxID=706981 RepID=A0A6A5SX03_9PLEO|nr:hypothetical protein EJ02DRAFT_419812 [Clathrospora elynae]